MSAMRPDRISPTQRRLSGRHIVAVMTFPPERIAGVKSEVLVLGAVSDEHDVVLLHPSFTGNNGVRIAQGGSSRWRQPAVGPP